MGFSVIPHPFGRDRDVRARTDPFQPSLDRSRGVRDVRFIPNKLSFLVRSRSYGRPVNMTNWPPVSSLFSTTPTHWVYLIEIGKRCYLLRPEILFHFPSIPFPHSTPSSLSFFYSSPFVLAGKGCVCDATCPAQTIKSTAVPGDGRGLPAPIKTTLSQPVQTFPGHDETPLYRRWSTNPS